MTPSRSIARPSPCGPDYTEAHNNLGNAYGSAGGQLGEAIAAYRQAIAVDADSERRQRGARWPNGPEVQFSQPCFVAVGVRSISKERLGRIRMAAGKPLSFCPRGAKLSWQPLWDGSGVVDRTILLHAEQGLRGYASIHPVCTAGRAAGWEDHY